MINYSLNEDDVISVDKDTIYLHWGNQTPIDRFPITKQQMAELGWLLVAEAGVINFTSVVQSMDLEELDCLAVRVTTQSNLLRMRHKTMMTVHCHKCDQDVLVRDTSGTLETGCVPLCPKCGNTCI